MPFTPGDPNINRLGRPARKRSLTLLLEQEVSRIDLASTIADALATGVYTFPETQRQIEIKDAQELLGLLKFIYRTVDSPANVAAQHMLPAVQPPASLSPGTGIPVEVLEKWMITQIDLIKRYVPVEDIPTFWDEWHEACRDIAEYIND